jgi:hypothetical protein
MTWEWVKEHAVECKGWQNRMLPERLNNQADKLAKSALVSALAGGHTIKGNLPFELVHFSLSGNKVSGSPRLALEADWGYHPVETLYVFKDIICWKEDFHLVWWKGIGAAMAKYLKMYQLWLTKHVSKFCGNNVHLYH